MDEENQKIRQRFDKLIKELEASYSIFKQGLPVTASLCLTNISVLSKTLADDITKGIPYHAHDGISRSTRA